MLAAACSSSEVLGADSNTDGETGGAKDSRGSLGPG